MDVEKLGEGVRVGQGVSTDPRSVLNEDQQSRDQGLAALVAPWWPQGELSRWQGSRGHRHLRHTNPRWVGQLSSDPGSS